MTIFAYTVAGVLLILIVAADVYATILDDRPRVGPLGDTLNRLVWSLGHAAASRLSRRNRHRALNLVGPLLMPGLIALYLTTLALGFALIYYPRLGAQFRFAPGFGRPAFWDALYFSGITLTTVGYGDIMPQARGMRLLAVAEAATGVALISLAITYLITVYGALQRKRIVALSFYHQAREGANVAGFVEHHFVRGEFRGLSVFMRMAVRDLQELMESHIELPILHYFHTVEVYKSMPRVLFLNLEMCAVLRSCLDEEAYVETCGDPEVRNLEASARHVLTEFVKSLGLDGERAGRDEADTFAESRRWELRFEQTLRHLEKSGIKTKRDRAAGWEEYRANREEWEEPLLRFARRLGYDWDEVTGDRDLRYAADEAMERPRPEQGLPPAGGREKPV
jgi:voltage-gated potassium channel Kch